jgi:clan AA aspartic protease
MISGSVTAHHEAVIPLRLRDAGGSEVDLEAVIDSGFSGALVLPLATVTALGLLPQTRGRAVLADGSIREFDVYAVEVAWDGAWRSVLVSAVGNEVLIGMRLLRDHALRIDVVPGGAVEITRLP